MISDCKQQLSKLSEGIIFFTVINKKNTYVNVHVQRKKMWILKCEKSW